MLAVAGGERELHGGKWEPGGWTLQASHVYDLDHNPVPYVVVHAYQADGAFSKGRVEADVVRTAADRRRLAERRLEAMVRERAALAGRIAALTRELEVDGLAPGASS
jgi:hypothetical protein